MEEKKKSSYSILPLFLERNASRAFSKESLAEEELMTLFEAARWAPSCYNNQPWRFVYVKKGDENWQMIFECLVEFNQSWCQYADVLVVVISKGIFERNGKISESASFDTGSAWMSLALEATRRHIIAHGMKGYDTHKLATLLHIKPPFQIEAMIAIGKAGNKEELPEELRKMETASNRKPLEEMVARGGFPFT